MTFRHWRAWVASLPWSLRWFVWLMLFRPILDIFWSIKEISPFLSPLNIVGVLTPAFILVSWMSPTFPRRTHTTLDSAMLLWSALLTLNSIATLTFGVSLDSLETALRLCYPGFIYFYLRHLVRSRLDLRGVLTTFLYSTAFPFAMLLYERLVSPLRDVVVTRGFERYEGLYADVNSYAAYVSGGLLVAAFFYIDRHLHRAGSIGRRTVVLGAVIGLVVVALVSMHHAASWAVFAALLLLLLFHAFRRGHLRLAVAVGLLGAAGYSLVGDVVTDRVLRMYDREVAILENRTAVSGAFHGRMSRWQRQVGVWNEMSTVAHVSGVAISHPPPYSMVGPGIHNDFLRVLFSSGWLGLGLYLSFYLILLAKTASLPVSERFLVRGAVAMVLLYSVTATVTTSLPVVYLTFAIFAFGAIATRPSPVPIVRRSMHLALAAGPGPRVPVNG